MMSRVFRRTVALAAVSLFVVAAAGCGTSDMSADAATVTNLGKGSDDVHVNRADFEDELQKLMANESFRSLLKANDISANKQSVDARVAASWLSQHITQAAIDAEFKARHAKVSEQDRTLGRDQVVRQFGGDQNAEKIVSSLPKKFRNELVEGAARGYAVIDSFADTSDTAARAYYDKHKGQFDCASGREVSHILVADEARANQIVAQLKSGTSFASLAQKYSTDPGSAKQGGKLGCLTSGTYVQEFQQAAEKAPVGTPVGPVKTQYGYHVILVTPFVNSFENAKVSVGQALEQQAQQRGQEALLKRIDELKVKVDPRYGKWGTVDDGQGGSSKQVIPPKSVDVRDRREPTTTTSTTAPATGSP